MTLSNLAPCFCLLFTLICPFAAANYDCLRLKNALGALRLPPPAFSRGLEGSWVLNESLTLRGFLNGAEGVDSVLNWGNFVGFMGEDDRDRG